jgi:hypothetical protein
MNARSRLAPPLVVLALAAAGVLAPLAHAQPDFTPVGSALSGGDDVLIVTSLPFPFTFPGGTTTTQVTVSTNGRIYPGAQSLSDVFESDAALASGPPSLNPYWDDLVTPQVYRNAGSNVTSFTWVNATEFGDTRPFTMQVQMFPDSSFRFLWDERVTDLQGGDCIVGISHGSGSTLLAFDWTSIATSSVPSTADYERFTMSDRFDLSLGVTHTSLTFISDGLGSTYAISGDGIPQRAIALPGRESCPFVKQAYTITEGFGSSYSVTPTGTFDASFTDGVPLTLGNDAVSAPQFLPFSFKFPGGFTTNSIQIDANGRVLPNSALIGIPGDPTPTVAELLSFPLPQICPLWTDLEPSSFPTQGNIWVHTTPTFVSITWDRIHAGIPSSPGRLNTVQLVLRASDAIEFHYRDIRLPSDRDVLIGISAGGGITDPGPVDWSSGSVFSSGAILYEHFPAGTFDLDETPSSFARLVLDAPELGSTLELSVFDTTGTATAITYVLGWRTGILTLPIPLAAIGLPNCTLYTDILLSPLILPGTPGGVTPAFMVPDDPGLVGFSGLSATAVVVNPTSIFPLQVTDEVQFTFGVAP